MRTYSYGLSRAAGSSSGDCEPLHRLECLGHEGEVVGCDPVEGDPAAHGQEFVCEYASGGVEVVDTRVVKSLTAGSPPEGVRSTTKITSASES